MDVEDQEKIFLEIYTECDNDNTNNVQVSELLSYIGPYIDLNSLHFEELKQTLDPTNVNPFIDKQTFLNAMMSWTEKFKNDVDFNFNNEEISRQSTPTKYLTVDYDGLNLSNISAYSLTGSVFSPIDPNVLQDQNNELQHQNKKLCECLDDVKYQLTGLEEQNVSLQNEIERINKTNQVDQKLIKSLQTKCAEYEKEREEHTRIANENKINCANFISIKRAKVEIENRLKELETQNKAHIETIERLSDVSNEKDEENEKLRKEIEERDAEILRIQEREAEWRQKCTENELNIKQFIAETNDLKNHIQSLEGLIQNQNQNLNHNQQNFMKMDNFEPDLQGVSPSPSSDKHKSTSLSPEEDFCEKQLQIQEQASPHESLHSELSHISTLDCFNSCEHRINQLEDEIAKLYDEMREQTEQTDIIRIAKSAVEQELAATRKEAKTFNDKYNSLTLEFNQLKINLETTLKEKQQLKSENNQINSKLSYYKVINKNFKTQLESKLAEVVTMRKKLKDKETKIASFEKEVLVLRSAEEKLGKLKEEISFRNNENRDLVEKLTAMKNSLHLYEEEVKEVKETNCKMMNEMCSLERAAKLERKRNTRIDLNCKINELEEQLDHLRNKNQHLTSTISGLTLDKQQLISKLELVESNDYGKRKVESLETKLHKYRRTITDLENQIEDLNLESRKSRQDYVTLMGYIDDAKATLNSANNLLKSTTKHASDVWKDILKNVSPHFIDADYTDIDADADADTDTDLSNAPLQYEIKLLNSQIYITTMLLNTFSKVKNKMIINEEKEKKWALNSNKIDVRTLYNPHESPVNATNNNESFLSKLSPKRFFLKPPTLVVKSKSKTQFVFPPMSPECSASAPPEMEMPDGQTEAETLPLKNVEQLELNNNVSVPAIPIIMSCSNSTTKPQEDESIERISANSTFTKTYSDSFIEKILNEQKIEDPLAKIEETRIFDDKDSSENSDAGESVSSKADDDDDDDADNDDGGDEEVVAKKNTKKKLKRGRKVREEEEMIKERLTRQVRSMSDGAAAVLNLNLNLNDDEDVMVFPNLQDDALDALGLKRNEVDEPKERLTEEEMEVKFQTLSLVFSIDAVTVGPRVQRLRRQRDHADENLSAEIARLSAAVQKLHPLCVDAETTELVTSLLDRLQSIVQASRRVLTCAEMYGSVQQEWRIAESVNLMLSHLRNVIKQRDAARRQLQITKRVLQETTSPSVLKKPGTTTTTTTTTRRLTINTLPSTMNGGRVTAITLPPRRASIHVIQRPLDSPSATTSASAIASTSARATVQPLIRRISVRRTSEAVSGERQEPSCRPWDYRRAQEWAQERIVRAPLLSRPSRLDINPELTKIQEGSTESFTSNNSNNDATTLDDSNCSDSGDEFQTPLDILEKSLIVEEYKRRVKRLLTQYLTTIGQMVRGQVERWAADGTLHEICFIGTTVCFAMATLLLWNTVIEIELAREGVHNTVPWKYVTWEEFYSLFYTKK